MAKITINDVEGGFNLQASINARLQQIEDEFNDKALYRDNPVGEPNSLSQDLDLDSNNVLNVNNGYFSEVFIDGTPVSEQAVGIAAQVAAEAAVEAGIARDEAVEAANSIGIQIATDIAELRTIIPTVDRQVVELLGHTTAGIGGGQFYYDMADTTTADDNGTVVVTSGNQRWKKSLQDFITPEDFGLTGSSAATDTTAYQKAVDFAIANKVRCLVNNDFTQSSNVTHDGNIILEINGNITITSAVTEAFGTTATQRGSEAELTADAVSGATVLTVPTAAITGIAVGDYLKIQSTEVFDPRTNSLFSEGAIVKSFTGSSITIDRPLVFGYTTANTAKVSVFKNHCVHITGKGSITGDATTNQWAFFLRNCINSFIGGGLRSASTRLGGFRYMDSLDSTLSNVSGQNHTAPTLGYTTTVFGASRNILLEGITSINTRHAFTTNNPAAPAAGIPIDITVKDSTCNGTISGGDAWDTHAAAWNIDFVRCRSYNSSASGFNFESASGSVVDCEEHDSNNEGYRIHNETFQGGVFEFVGNTGEGCSENGFQLGSPIEAGASVFSKVIVDKNEYSDSGQNGLWLNTKLGTEVFVGANFITNSSSSDVVFDADNIRFTNIFNDVVSNLAASAALEVDPRSKVVTISTAGTISTINGLVEGQSYYLRKSSNGNVVVLDETGNMQLNTGTSYTLANSSTLVLLIRVGSVIFANPVS